MLFAAALAGTGGGTRTDGGNNETAKASAISNPEWFHPREVGWFAHPENLDRLLRADKVEEVHIFSYNRNICFCHKEIKSTVTE